MDADLAWAAGFIDGEGCIAVCRQLPTKGRESPSHRLEVNVANTDHDTILRLKRIFGVGAVHGRKRGNYLKVWNFCVTGSDAKKVLDLVTPYLFTKRKEAQLAEDFYELLECTKQQGRLLPIDVVAQRDAYYWAVREQKYCDK